MNKCRKQRKKIINQLDNLLTMVEFLSQYRIKLPMTEEQVFDDFNSDLDNNRRDLRTNFVSLYIYDIDFIPVFVRRTLKLGVKSI